MDIAQLISTKELRKWQEMEQKEQSNVFERKSGQNGNAADSPSGQIDR